MHGRGIGIAAAGAAALGVYAFGWDDAARSSEPDEVVCARLGLMAPVAAQETRVIRLARFVNAEEIEEIKAHVAEMRRQHEVGTLERGKDGRPKLNGAWQTSYLHTENAFARKMPALYERMRTTIQKIDAQEWRVTSAFPSSEVHFRTIECHEYHAGGRLTDARHFDAGSLVTMDIMLTAPGVEFDDGAFVTTEVDGTVTTHTFEKGDCLLFVSHKLHNVRPVTRGKRVALVAEIWHGPERTCAHRCAHLGPCDYTLARSHMAKTAQDLSILG